MFRSCIAQSASTLPSHRSMFQSRPASLTDDERPVLAELMRDAGWRTIALTGGGNISAELGFDRGFAEYEEDRAGLSWAVPRIASWWEEGNREPFFAFVHTYDPHVPYDPPPPFDALYFPDYDGAVTGAGTRELCRRVRGLEGDGDPPRLSPVERRRIRSLYAGGVRYTDAEVGRLLRVLEGEGFESRTLVIVVSDHGEELWDHGTVLHSHTVFQELVHVPLILRDPNDERGGALVAETVRNLDVAPTILEGVGLPVAGSFDGVSLVGRLRGEIGPSLPAVSEMGRRKAFVDGPWKLVLDGRAGSALYDLQNDPGETRDVAAEHPERVREFRTLLAGLGGIVRELSAEAPSPELTERLRALGYID
jgi:arylsulfatase A-like enzyme